MFYTKDQKILITFLTVIFSFLTEVYIVIVENVDYLYNFKDFQFIINIINLISLKHLIFFLIIFLIVFLVLFNKDFKEKLFFNLYKYRLPIAILVVIASVILELHGSSIAQLNISNSSYHPLFGISRSVRSDEFNVFTPFAFSQYHNDFAYFSDILRAVPTDMFIIYGQPIWDLTTIYRPFLIGFLFLSPAKGLSFFWITRLIALLLVSFEFGTLISNKNKILALSYSLLLSFSPLVQWWFSINSLVEMLVFGELFILLLDYYMKSKNYKKRAFITIFLIISAGGFLFALYPPWEIPLGYVFLILAIWVMIKNKNKFEYSKKDLLLVLLFIFVLAISLFYIFTRSYDTIIAVMNTVYPGYRMFLGGGRVLSIFDYLSSIFYTVVPQNISIIANNYSFIISFFPINLILLYIVQIRQKENDKLLYLLFLLYMIFLAYYIFILPEIIGKITLLSKSINERLLQIVSFLDLLILIRSLAFLKNINISRNKLAIISLTIASICIAIFVFARSSKFNSIIFIVSFIILVISFYVILNASNKKYQKVFLAITIFMVFISGALVNPICTGTDFYFNQPIIEETSAIVKTNPNATWIVEGNIYCDEIIGVGAHTLNSVNTYPNFETWKKIDPNNQYYDVYNRYAHIPLVLYDSDATKFVKGPDDAIFILFLNTNDLKKLSVNYVLTPSDLSPLNSENITFIKLYEDNNSNKIYKIKYS